MKSKKLFLSALGFFVISLILVISNALNIKLGLCEGELSGCPSCLCGCNSGNPGSVAPCNTPPAASVTCDPADCEAYIWNSTSIDSCGLKLQNASTDDEDCPDGVPCDGYNGFKSCYLDINNKEIEFFNCSDFPVTVSLSEGIYTDGAKLTITDQGDLSGSDQKTITFKKDAYAKFECSLDNIIWEGCADISPEVNTDVYFRAIDGSNLSAPSSGATLTCFDWDFGDGGTGTGAAISHVYANPILHDVILTIADSAGRRAKANQTVTVSEVAGYSGSWTEISPGGE